jgi:uncharacterized membrane protein
LFFRAAQNLEMAERLGADAGASNAVKVLIDTYRGRSQEAMQPGDSLEGQHPYVLLSRIYRAADRTAAIEAAEALLRVEPDSVRALNDRGILLAAQNRTAARTAFEQVARLSKGFIEGRTNLATSKLASDQEEGLAELNDIITNEPDLTHRARFVRNFFRINAIAIIVFPIAGVMAIFGVLRLARMGTTTRFAHRSKWGASIRLAFLLVILLILSFQSVVWTLPTYGAVGPLLPSLFALIGR